MELGRLLVHTDGVLRVIRGAQQTCVLAVHITTITLRPSPLRVASPLQIATRGEIVEVPLVTSPDGGKTLPPCPSVCCACEVGEKTARSRRRRVSACRTLLTRVGRLMSRGTILRDQNCPLTRPYAAHSAPAQVIHLRVAQQGRSSHRDVPLGCANRELSVLLRLQGDERTQDQSPSDQR